MRKFGPSVPFWGAGGHALAPEFAGFPSDPSYRRLRASIHPSSPVATRRPPPRSRFDPLGEAAPFPTSTLKSRPVDRRPRQTAPAPLTTSFGRCRLKSVEGIRHRNRRRVALVAAFSKPGPLSSPHSARGIGGTKTRLTGWIEAPANGRKCRYGIVFSLESLTEHPGRTQTKSSAIRRSDSGIRRNAVPPNSS